MMTVTFARHMHPEVTTLGGIVSRPNSGFALRISLHLPVVDGHHGYTELRDLDALHSENGPPRNVLQWPYEPLRVRAVPRKHEAAFTSCESMEQGRRSNISAPIVRKET